MTIPTPTLATVRANLWARFRAQIPALNNAPANSNAEAISDAIAGGIHQTRGAIPKLAEEAHPATATGTHLEALANVWGIERQDDETDESLRNRLHERIRNPTSIGTLADWRYWASIQTDGASNPHPVTRASVTASPNEVAIGIRFDGRESPVATAAELQAITASLRKYQAAGSELRVFAITSETLNISISNLSPGGVENQDKATESITDLIVTTQNAGETVRLVTLYHALSVAGIEGTITSPTADQTPTSAAAVFVPVVSYT